MNRLAIALIVATVLAFVAAPTATSRQASLARSPKTW
jgi:hypothetical protein